MQISDCGLKKECLYYSSKSAIRNLFDYLETGETLEIFLDDFPSVAREQALDVLDEYATRSRPA
jgi:uncharacterized protein (DUF433 family)